MKLLDATVTKWIEASQKIKDLTDGVLAMATSVGQLAKGMLIIQQRLDDHELILHRMSSATASFAKSVKDGSIDVSLPTASKTSGEKPN